MKKPTTGSTVSTVVILSVVTAVIVAAYVAGPWGYRKRQETKYKELIHAVESAATPAEEKAAFTLAAQSGGVWSTGYVHDDHLPERVHHLKGKMVYHIEWFELGLSKESTTAYRVILDESNLQYLKSTRPTGNQDNKKREQHRSENAGH